MDKIFRQDLPGRSFEIYAPYLHRDSAETCSYCKGKMELVLSRKKRAVPRGAVDLNIFDEEWIYRCPSCKNKEDARVFACRSCKGLFTSVLAYGAPPEVGVKTESEPQKCSNCSLCYQCHSTLGNRTYVGIVARWDETGASTFISGRDSEGVYRSFLFHVTCAGANYEHAIATARSWIDTEIRSWEKVMLEKKRRHAVEEKQKAEQTLQKEMAKRHEIEAEKKRRLINGLCSSCGGKLGMIERLSGGICGFCKMMKR